LEQADVVVYDRLMDPALLQAAPESAERVFVGKERGRQALTQAEINQLIVDRASEGKAVVRLKGGDPFVFGRGGEEALALAENSVRFEVVPGITSAVAAPAYAGIPVTHRRVASCFTVVSGSEDPSKPQSVIPWDILARTGGTLVVLMGWAALESILQKLQDEGMAPDTPVALVQWGTWTKQRTVTGTMVDALARAKEAGLGAPVIAVIGDVVRLRDQIRWFDNGPLAGRKVLITRSRTQASKFRSMMEDLGAEPLELPSIEIAPLLDYGQIDATLARLNEFNWVIFASANGVEAVFDRLGHQGLDSRALGHLTVGAIGPATAEALLQRGIRADFIPRRSVSEEVVKELADRDWPGVSVLLPGADIGRDVLAQGLSDLGATVEQIGAYRTITPEGSGKKARQLLSSGVDAVTFTSSSTVRNLVDILDGEKELLESSLVACIGPITAATAKEIGLRVDLVAERHTVEGLVESLANYYAAE
jgi:uroporphyrinogen III methyltransferase/synthase